MPDPWQRPVPGQPFVPNAAQFGLFLDTSRDVQQLKRQLAGAGKTAGGPTYVLVRNDTGGDLTELHPIVGLGDPIITPADRESVVHEEPVFEGLTPDAAEHEAKFAVLTSPLKDGAIGRAVISGLTWVKLDLGGAITAVRAELSEGDTAALSVDDADGSALVLWHAAEQSDEAPVWALVRLSNPPDAGAAVETTDCRCDTESMFEGVPLDGDPTVCCVGHELWAADFGEQIGIKQLYHQGDDLWSTFSGTPAEDNPYERDCTAGTDEYDLVMDLAATPPSISLIFRDGGSGLLCDEVCAVWELDAPEFNCQGPNQFMLTKFLGFEPLLNPVRFPLKRCVCLRPVPGVANCVACPDSEVPLMFVEIAGVTNGSRSDCANFNGFHAIPTGVCQAACTSCASLGSGSTVFSGGFTSCCAYTSVSLAGTACGLGVMNIRVIIGTNGSDTRILVQLHCCGGSIVAEYTTEFTGSLCDFGDDVVLSRISTPSGCCSTPPLFITLHFVPPPPSESGHCDPCDATPGSGT